MNQRNKIATVYGLWFADLVGIVISFVLATYIRFRNFRDMEDKGIHFQVCLLLLLVCTIYSFFLDWNRNFVKRKTIKEFAAIVQYEIIMFLSALCSRVCINLFVFKQRCREIPFCGIRQYRYNGLARSQLFSQL